jgi:hypothetical protein
MRDWNAVFSTWGAAPSNTEQEKCGNAERAIRKAIDASPKLSSKTIEIFAQGSYANGTNVRQDSDVDICVLYKGTFYDDYTMSQGLNREVFGFVSAEYRHSEFKTDVQSALLDYFGKPSVRQGSKAVDIHANTYRVDADVVACFEYHRYWGNSQNYGKQIGTKLLTADGSTIINWPKQNYENGVEKNKLTGRQFKAVTRVLKSLRYELQDEDNEVAKRIPSYLIECLIWNVPNPELSHGSLMENVRASIIFLWRSTEDPNHCSEWREVNQLKYLFRPSQPWILEDVRAFLLAAWNHVGFE